MRGDRGYRSELRTPLTLPTLMRWALPSPHRGEGQPVPAASSPIGRKFSRTSFAALLKHLLQHLFQPVDGRVHVAQFVEPEEARGGRS